MFEEEAKKIPTKQRILDAATELFHQKSYGDTTLYDVADAIGLKQGHVYYHFKTKRELGLAVLNACHDQVKGALDMVAKASNPQERLISFLKLSGTIEDYYMQWGCPIASLTDALIRESKNKKERAQVPLIYKTQIAWFQKNFEELGFEKPKARAEAENILTHLQGAIHIGYTLDQPKIFKDFIKNMIAHIKAI